ncbi:DUF2752 domain-containing protein [Clostridium sp. KNHs205]|uniref:DUF2752 domain-containing protein n=1 Tax=Clostridium sp. KNHs205 TaxID=1449050 RepID=UPI00051C2939|nr:DUF2752 domain-containing protein [Clostridium sp. KNHs205]
MKERVHKVIYYSSLLGIIGMAYYLFGKYTGLYIPCVFRLVTGFYCPGCGSTRLAAALIEGRLTAAFRSNEALFLMLPILAIFLIKYLIRYIKGMQRSTTKTEKIVTGIMLVGVIAFGIMRNIPYFSYLRP